MKYERGSHGKGKFFAKASAPPQREGWVWQTRAMLTSPAWLAMSGTARKILDRILVEHLAHGGQENGKLPITYAHFREYGIPHKSIAPALRELVALGLISIDRGSAGNRELRQPSLYRIRWLPTPEDTQTYQAWKRYETIEAAMAAAEEARGAKDDHAVERGRKAQSKIQDFSSQKGTVVGSLQGIAERAA
jgi:hypothetical protein